MPKFILAIVLILLVSCSDDTTSPQLTDMGSSEADMARDQSPSPDVSADAEVDAQDSVPDMGAMCQRPSPVVAGTSATDALADAPARCGMPDYQWLRSTELGDVVEYGDSQNLRAALVASAAEFAGITLPRAPEYNVAIDQIAYRTQDRGAPIDATTLIARPSNLEADEPVPVLLLLHGTVGFNDNCSPSNTQEQRALAAVFASFGYVVVAPDFIGLKGFGESTGFKHPYLVGEATAIASLDALRALYKLPAEELDGLCPSTEFAFFGGSQGGHAALWVDRLAPYYAGELTPLGGVAAVPPADLTTQVDRALESIVDATANTVGFYGAASQWYGYESDLGEVFAEPWDTDVPNSLATSCDGDGFEPPDTLDALFSAEILQAAEDDALAEYGVAGCMLVENSLTTTSIERIPSELPSYGILNLLGEQDDLVHTPIERDAYRTLCEQGVPVEYLECAGGGHVDTIFWSFQEILDFLEDRFARVGFDAPTDCEVPAPVTCSGTP